MLIAGPRPAADLLAGDARATHGIYLALARVGNGRGIRRSCLAHPIAGRRAGDRGLPGRIVRLERIFSLYLADRHFAAKPPGPAGRPPLELVELLAFSARVSAATGGAFDVTVQPLWDLYAGRSPTRPRTRLDLGQAALAVPQGAGRLAGGRDRRGPDRLHPTR